MSELLFRMVLSVYRVIFEVMEFIRDEKQMIDLTYHVEIDNPIITSTILTCYFRLDKKTMLNVLQSNSIYIKGEYFKVPEKALLQCLINNRYGETKLELEKI